MMGKIVIKSLSHDKFPQKGVYEWPIYVKEKFRFPWSYDSVEEYLILEGYVEKETIGKRHLIKPADFVTFSKGIECKGNILSGVNQYYNFS